MTLACPAPGFKGSWPVFPFTSVCLSVGHARETPFPPLRPPPAWVLLVIDFKARSSAIPSFGSMPCFFID